MKKILSVLLSVLAMNASADTAQALISGYRDIVGNCTLNSSNLYFDFKNVVKTDRATHRNVGTLLVTCPNTLNYSVYRIANSVVKTNGVQSLYVNIYSDSNYSVLNDVNHKMLMTGTGSAQTLSFYGELSLMANSYVSVLNWTGALQDDSYYAPNNGKFQSFYLNTDLVLEF